MLGSASIISAPTAPETLVRSVCSSGASAVTSTVSPSLLTVSSTGTRTVSVAATAMPVRLKVANPEAHLDRVGAGRQEGAVNRPASVVTNSLGIGGFVGEDDGRAGHDGFVRVGDGAGDRRRADLRECGGRPGERQQEHE